jgi:RNA polymerase sigma factor (sigma-70 family)
VAVSDRHQPAQQPSKVRTTTAREHREVGGGAPTPSLIDSEIAEDRAMVNLELQQAAVLLVALEPHHRDVLLLHLWAGLSYDEIAIALDIPSGTVRSRLSRARQAIRDRVAEVPEPSLHPHRTRRIHDR